MRSYALVLLVLVGLPARPADRFVEDVQVSRSGSEATVSIQLGCPMRSVSDRMIEQGRVLEIRLRPLESCRGMGLGNGVASELYRPPSGRMARLSEVEYESLGVGDTVLSVRFEVPLEYRLAQSGDLLTVDVRVNVTDGAVSTPASPAVSDTARAPARIAAAANSVTDTGARTPIAARTRRAEGPRDYVLNLKSSRQAIDAQVGEPMPKLPGLTLYLSDIEVDGVVWHRLRLGFFGSEEEARATLTRLNERFPKAWIGRADAAEITAAARGPAASSAPGTAGRPALRPAVPPAASSDIPSSGGHSSPERIGELMSKARTAMLSEDYPAAIRLYTAALRVAGPHRQQAREYLGLAREKNGQLAHAKAEYQAFLEEFPDSPAASRVSQRLAGLVMAAEVPREKLRAANETQGAWEIFSGVSQYYRRDVSDFNPDADPVLTQSALLSDVDFSVRRRGGRVDMLGRVSLTHLYDFLADGKGSGDQTRLSYAYFDLDDTRRDWSFRFGRQTMHTGGVLGRFDGLHAAHGWGANRTIHFTAGYPVESTRDGMETGRRFYGVALDFNGIGEAWNFSAFLNRQSIGGIEDRKAAGGEVRYLGDSRSLYGLVDYDVGYGKLNTLLILGTWRFDNRLVLNALIDRRQSPFLTTRNALIGQPVQNIDDLLLLFTEDEIRQLAVDRTAESRSVTLGLSAPLAERFQVNADITRTQTDGTVASGGVLAIPSFGQQTYYTVNFVGSSLFKSGDVTVFGLRYGESERMATSLLTLDTRLPVGSRVRLNPRLRVAVREDLSRDSRRVSFGPSFRVLFNARRRYRFELEVGRNFMQQESTARATQDLGDYFLNVGYRADF